MLRLSQAKKCSKKFEIGSLPRIHGKITILHVNHIIVGPQHGFLKVALLPNGNHPVQIRYYGLMENVGVPDAYAFNEADIRFRSGCRKECLLVR